MNRYPTIKLGNQAQIKSTNIFKGTNLNTRDIGFEAFSASMNFNWQLIPEFPKFGENFIASRGYT